MRDIKDDLKFSGYSQEEIYFHQLNQELIRKFKQKMRRQALVERGASAKIIEFPKQRRNTQTSFKKAA